MMSLYFFSRLIYCQCYMSYPESERIIFQDIDNQSIMYFYF